MSIIRTCCGLTPAGLTVGLTAGLTAGLTGWKQPLPNVLDNKEVFLHACATVAFALRAVADAVRTRTEKLPYYRVHSVTNNSGN
jgi:hypothetical protein